MNLMNKLKKYWGIWIMKFKEYKLEEIINIEDNKRKPLSALQRKAIKGYYPYYGAQEIIDYINDYIFDGKYLLIAEDGENVRSQVKPLVKIVKGKFWLNNHAHIVTAKEGFSLEYIYYALLKYNFSAYITGTTQPKLNQLNLRNIILLCPEISYQNKIGKLLSIIDNKIKKNNNINDNLLEIGKILLDYIFQQEYDKIQLNKVVKFIKGKKPIEISSKYKSNFKKYLTIACLNGQELNYANPTKTILADNDLIMVMDGANSGEIYYYDKGIIGSTLAKLQITDKLFEKGYLYFVLKKFTKLIKSKKTGSAIPHTDKVFVGNIEIPILNTNEQQKFNKLFMKINQNKKENETLEQLRDTLLPKLMNGEIDLDKIKI